MVSVFCIAAPTRPLPRLFPAVCASTPRLPVGSVPHCLTTVLDSSSRYVLVSWSAGMADEAPIVCRPSPRHSITPRLTFVKRGACKPESQERSYTLLRNGIYSTTFSSQFAFGVSPDLLYGLTWRGCTACAPERDCPSCRFHQRHAVSHGLR